MGILYLRNVGSKNIKVILGARDVFLSVNQNKQAPASLKKIT